MKRQIKFRAWIADREEMATLENSGLQYYYDFEGNYSLGFTIDGYSGFWAHEQYETATKNAEQFPIMQFTGLLDKNGTEIYEGDVCDGHSDGPGVITWTNHDGGYEYVFDDGNSVGFWELFGQATVIGNIHQHPNLLNS